jgi:hypothetical protein
LPRDARVPVEGRVAEARALALGVRSAVALGLAGHCLADPREEATATDGHPPLAEAALAAVRQWRYEPVLGADKKPVEAKLTITVNFRLAD